MQWSEVENFVVERVKQRLEVARASNPTGFHQDFAAAYEPLKDYERNISYDSPLTGEAYALKYHLQRADNLYVALDRINKIHPILKSPKNLVLDVGAGTGGSAMALMRWIAVNNVNLQQRAVKLVLAEPSTPMRIVAEEFVPGFAQRLGFSAGFENNIRSSNLQECAALCERAPVPYLDLVTFCYTFWIQEESEWAQTTADVLRIARGLKPNGTLLFLTPNQKDKTKPSYAKVMFMKYLREELKKANFKHFDISLPSGFSPGRTTCVQGAYDNKWPIRVCDLIAETLQIPPLVGDDRPYYAFSAIADAFAPQ